MSVKFNVLWLEDTNTWLTAEEKALKKAMDAKGLIFIAEKYDDIDLFEAKLVSLDKAGFYGKFDLVLVDYNLSSKKSLTGDKFINEIRESNVHCDILFYSSDKEAEIRKIITSSIASASGATSDIFEGTYISTRIGFRDKVLQLADKNIKRANRIIEFRGSLLDSSSEFDFIMRESIKILFDKLTTDTDKNEILKKIENAVVSAKTKSDGNFSDIASAIGKQKIRKIIDSIYYVMDLSDKYDVLDTILKKLGMEKIFETKTINEYRNNIIAVRNTLAHKKIDLAPCENFLTYYDKMDDLTDCSCINYSEDGCDSTHTDIKKISADEAKGIRTALFLYWKEFDELFKKIMLIQQNAK